MRHPNVGRVIARDFALMVRLARLAAWLPATRDLRLDETLKQFAGPLREQVRPLQMHEINLQMDLFHIIIRSYYHFWA